MIKVILASSSNSRRQLLEDVGIEIAAIIPADIDESRKKSEKPLDLVKRLAYEKAVLVAKNIVEGIVIAADTIVTCNGKILDKALTDDDVRSHLAAMSGKRANVISSVFMIKKNQNLVQIERAKTVISTIKIKSLEKSDIEYFVKTGDGIGKSGGFAIEGKAPHFIQWIKGSYSSIMGLPMYEVYNLLKSLGYDHKSKGEN